MGDPTLSDQLRSLGALVEELAASMVALAGGPAEGGATAVAVDETVREAWAELVTSYHDLAGILSRLETARAPFLRRQVEALNLGDTPHDLQLCLTGSAPPPWITVGFPPARIVMNLRWGLPFPACSARYIYFALALEHFYYKDHALAVMRDIRRVLADDGVLRVVVPDIEKYIRAYAAGDDAFFTGHRAHWPWAQHVHTPMDYLQGMSGAGMGRAPGGFFDHKMGYDLATLSLLLRDAGFTRIAQREYMTSDHAGLAIDHVSHDASFGHAGRNYNLFVDARP